MRVGFVVLVVLTTVAGLSVAAEQPAPIRSVPGDAQDLMLFLESRPYLIRLHLQVKGRSFRTDWDESVSHLFRYLDKDGDGCLNKKEAALVPSKTQWVQLMTGVVVEPDAAPEFGEFADSPAATKITRGHFLHYYRRSGAGALQVEWGWRPPAQDRLTDALFQHLDKDKNGSLSPAELSAAQAALNRLDVNGDEIVQATELSPGGAYPLFTFRSTRDGEAAPKNFPFTILAPDASSAALGSEIVSRYDRDKDRTLSRKELLVEKAVFEDLDTNRDGRLEVRELARWKKRPPDLELIVPLERGKRKDILVLPNPDKQANRLTALRSPSRDGALRIPVADKQLEVVRDSGTKARGELLKQFDGMAGKDGVLTEKQIYQPPFTFVALLHLADRDGDNRLSHKELAEYLEIQEKFLFRTSYLTVVDRGASLFEFFDADHDGRLSPRELRTVGKRLSVWDREKTGRMTRRQVPRQFQLVLSYGQPRATFPFPDEALPMCRRSATVRVVRCGSARWTATATAMCRNPNSWARGSNSDASMRDGDGLIDVSEAERADAGFRKRK